MDVWLHNDNGNNCRKSIFLHNKLNHHLYYLFMKKIILIIFVFISSLTFAQEKITVQSGYITFNSNAMFDFKDLVIEGDDVNYFNSVTQSQMHFKLNAVKQIVDNTGATVYAAVKTSVNKQTVEADGTTAKKPEPVPVHKETLVYRSYNSIYAGDKKLGEEEAEALFIANSAIYDKYKTGVDQAKWGDGLIGGGLGFATGWTLGGLLANGNAYGTGPGIAVGLVATLIGIPLKAGGTKKVKQAVDDYNNTPVNQVSYLDNAEFKFTAGVGSVGFQVRF